MSKVGVHFKKVHELACAPVYGTDKSAGFDFHTVEKSWVAQGQVKLVRTGLVIETPPGHMLYITGRSSTPRRHGIQVITGIVDEDYCGPQDELRLQIVGLRPSGAIIEAQTSIAQGIFVPITRANFVESKVLTAEKSRGGFGSTG